MSNIQVICKFVMCQEISTSFLGGFSVVKHLYSLEIAIYCYKELRRNVLDFWSSLQTEKPARTAHFMIACRHDLWFALKKNNKKFPRGRDNLCNAHSNFTTTQIDQSEVFSLFQSTTNKERAWSQGSPALFSSMVMCKRKEPRLSSGADPGEVKRVNFHPPFSEPPSFCLFVFLSLKYWNNIWCFLYFHPPFQNPGSAHDHAIWGLK